VSKASECHPDRQHYAKGKCKPCWRIAWNAETTPEGCARREKKREYNRIYHAKNPRTSDQLRKAFQDVRIRALKAIGDNCVHCGYSDVRALQIDHIHGGGHAERKTQSSGTGYYYFILHNPDKKKYQVLCANCNVIKRLEQRECVK